MFPAAAALAWAVLVYIGVDFGFWGKVLDMSNNAERVWRGAGGANLGAAPLGFFFFLLNLRPPPVRLFHITLRLLFFFRPPLPPALFFSAVAFRPSPVSL